MKSIKTIIVLIFTLSVLILPQNFNKTKLDSLYNLYMNLRFPNAQIKSEVLGNNSANTSFYEKCGLGISNEIRANLSSFSPEQQDKLKKILARPVLDSSIVSPSGKFRIHFDTTGSSSIKYSLSDLAVALDSAYNYEINTLGYPAPPTDSLEGGDSLYDVYVMNLGLLYGETDFDKDLGSNRFTTYILMDDDFAGYFTEGINAARVTAAHEFHHAIQVGNYIWRSTDRFFYELTSTAMEEIVYPTINDYFQYLNTYFNNPQISVAKTNGYELGLWDIFLNSKFGSNIIKRQWELMVTNNAISSISKSLIENNSNFALALNDFGLWTFFTNYRTQSGKYFDDAAFYPIVKPVSTVQISGINDTVSFTSQPLANNYLKFVNNTTSDSIDVIITNTDVISGSDNLSKIFNVKYVLLSNKELGATKISNNYYSKLVVNFNNLWKEADLLNNQIVVQPPPLVIGSEEGFIYPNPFSYSRATNIYVPVINKNTTQATLNIYSSSLTLLYSNNLNVINVKGKNYVNWNGKQLNNKKLPTGVYIYVTKFGDDFLKGKLVIFNE